MSTSLTPARELQRDREIGIDLPDVSLLSWIRIASPMEAKTIPDVAKLGEGEQEVLALALQSREAVVIMDERLGRSYAESLDLRATGTLGILSAQRGKAESSITTLARTTTANYSDSVSIVSARTRETLLKRAAEIA